LRAAEVVPWQGPLGVAAGASVAALPTGTVTFLFTDVEGSTQLLQTLGEGQYELALAEHRRVLREAFRVHGGVEVDTQGDAFFVAFPTASGALIAAAEAQRSLSAGPIRVRVGVHTGAPLVTSASRSPDRGGRTRWPGRGVSRNPCPRRFTLRDLGEHRLEAKPERLFQLRDDDFPPLKSLYPTNLPVPRRRSWAARANWPRSCVCWRRRTGACW
jgi:Adenylate and Guanylate cyclase catalytic domain